MLCSQIKVVCVVSLRIKVGLRNTHIHTWGVVELRFKTLKRRFLPSRLEGRLDVLRRHSDSV